MDTGRPVVLFESPSLLIMHEGASTFATLKFAMLRLKVEGIKDFGSAH